MGVKDVPAKEFIEAFAKHLKKGNKFKIPDVSTNPEYFPYFCVLFSYLFVDV